MDNATLDRVAEALIFAADEPVTGAEIAAVYTDVTGNEEVDGGVMEEAVERLNLDYADGGRTFRIQAWAGGYRMATIREVAPFVRAFVQAAEERRLSRSLMETLSVIAYKQPVSKPEVDFVRGVDADYAIKKLLEKKFVTVVGRSEAIGRPLLYGTTDFFLEQFGLNALEELPRPREIEQLLNDPAFVHERTELMINLDTDAQALDSAQTPQPDAEPATEDQ